MANEPMNGKKTEAINLRVDAEFKSRLTDAAMKERRSVTNMVMKILSDWMEDNAEKAA